MRQDELSIEILQDGTIKVSTDQIGQANHVNAEGFLKELARLVGGPTQKQRKSQTHAHHHGHEHDHEHAGH